LVGSLCLVGRVDLLGSLVLLGGVDLLGGVGVAAASWSARVHPDGTPAVLFVGVP
jgi:hypothetical protein